MKAGKACFLGQIVAITLAGEENMAERQLATIKEYQTAFDNKDFDTIAEFLNGFAMFRGLEVQVRRAIATCCKLRSVDEADIVLIDQDSSPEVKNAIKGRKPSNTIPSKAILMLSGLAERGRREKDIVIDYVGAGDGVGLQSLITHEPQFYRTIARRPCHFIEVDATSFRKVVGNNIDIMTSLLRFTQRVYFREVLLHDRTKRLDDKYRVYQLIQNIIDNTEYKMLDGTDSRNVTYPFVTWLNQAVISRQTGISPSWVSKAMDILRDGPALNGKKYSPFIKGGTKKENIEILPACVENLSVWLDETYTEMREDAFKRGPSSSQT